MRLTAAPVFMRANLLDGDNVAVEHVQAALVGGGQAGLAVSRELTGLGIEHVVLERGRVAQTWRDRWESFCLVTPNWTVQLPGYAYDGADPDGFVHHDEIVAYPGHEARFAPDLGESVAWGDERYEQFAPWSTSSFRSAASTSRDSRSRRGSTAGGPNDSISVALAQSSSPRVSAPTTTPG